MRKVLLWVSLFAFLPGIGFSQVALDKGYHQSVLNPLEGALVRMNAEGELVRLNVDELKSKKYLFIYFSANWCPPCHIFTPKLVDFYKQQGDNKDFEVILLSLDQSADEMTKYMREAKMPWAAVRFRAPESEILFKYAGQGIPRLVLLDENDRIVASHDSYDLPDVVLEAYVKLKGSNSK